MSHRTATGVGGWDGCDRLAGLVLALLATVALADGPTDVREAFVRCGDSTRLGQTRPVAGATCSQACQAFGLKCLHRAAQANLDACTPAAPERSGTCDDVFQPSWSSQCVCESKRAAGKAGGTCEARRKPADRACTHDDECVAVSHLLDCCGSMTVTGINRRDQSRFEAFERECEAPKKTCKCEAAATTIDEGRLTTAAPRVRCRQSVCTTTSTRE